MPAQNKLGPLNIHHAYQRALNHTATLCASKNTTFTERCTMGAALVAVIAATFGKDVNEVTTDLQKKLEAR